MRIPKMMRRIIIDYYAKKKKQEIGCINIPIDILKNKIGVGVMLGENVTFIDRDVEIKDYTYINSGYLYPGVRIGKYCSMGHDVCIGPGEHYINRLSTYPICTRVLKEKPQNEFPKVKPTILNNDIWVGHGAVIMQGVKVGNGAIVAAGAVVTKDVPAYSIVAGVPAKIIKYRFGEELIQKLDRLQWWDKEEEWIVQHKELFTKNIYDDNLFKEIK